MELADEVAVNGRGKTLLGAGRLDRFEWLRTLGRCARYLGFRAIVVALTVLIGVYVAIWVTNLGGYGDEQLRLDIDAAVRMSLIGVGLMPLEEREAYIRETQEALYAAADLDRPFWIRSFDYWVDAFTLSLGETRAMTNAAGSNKVIDILLPRLPATILLFGVSSIFSFFGGLYIALILSRKYGTLADKTATLLVPAFAAPPWFHGLILIVLFASLIRMLPFGGLVDAPPPDASFAYGLSILKHLILPVTASVLGTLPYAVYANRALFLIHSSEDYVDLAKAKGIRPSRLRVKYILRPVLPAVITNFVLVSIVSWQSVILTESVFNWPGLGSLLVDALAINTAVIDGKIPLTETSVIVGTATLFAYLIGASTLILDLLYVLADPRVSLQSRGRT